MAILICSSDDNYKCNPSTIHQVLVGLKHKTSMLAISKFDIDLTHLNNRINIVGVQHGRYQIWPVSEASPCVRAIKPSAGDSLYIRRN